MPTYKGWSGINDHFPRIVKTLKTATVNVRFPVGGRGSIYQPPRPVIGQLFPRGIVTQKPLG